MAENTPEGAISPVQPVETKKSRFPSLKISLPSFLGGKPKTEIAPDITPIVQTTDLTQSSPAVTQEAVVDVKPAVQAGDFVPMAAPIEQGVGPLNAMAAEIPVAAAVTPIASVDSIAQDVQKDFAAQMAPSAVSISPETHSAQIDQVPAGLNDQTKDTAIGMAAISNSFPGTGMSAPEMTAGFTTPTNPPTETATVPPITIGAENLAPTPINAEATAAPSAPADQAKELVA
jgi:hypothetical protein